MSAPPSYHHTLGELAQTNFTAVSLPISLNELRELLNTKPFVVVEENGALLGVLTPETVIVGNCSLNRASLTPPLLADPEEVAVTFCQQHLQDLRPIIVRTAEMKVLGLVTPSRLLNSLFKALEVQAAFFATLLDTVNEAVTVVTAQGYVSYWNNKAQAMYGIPEQAIVGKPIASFFEREALATLTMLHEGRPIHQAYHRPRPGTHVLLNASPVMHDGTVVGAISSEQDITQIVRLNEELSSASSQLRDLKQKVSPSIDPFDRIIGKGKVMRQTTSLARKVAGSEATVLITGESGVGKDLFAQAIHLTSSRATAQFVAINCGAIPAALFESELFGYQGGAFTGAERKGKPGKLELAHQGTLFLDEVGELPLELQVKLLRVLQDKCFYRVGGTTPITVDTRIIAATNRNLEQMMRRGQFREDLYYRLNVISLEVPALRARTDDIPELVQSFLQEFARKYNKPLPMLDPDIMVSFLTYNWPGNVRELRNITERLAILADGEILSTQYLPASLQCLTASPAYNPARIQPSFINHPRAENSLSDQAEIAKLRQALQSTYGNKSAAAKLLGISRGTLYYRLKHYGLV